jgi:hypothetical protein
VELAKALGAADEGSVASRWIAVETAFNATDVSTIAARYTNGDWPFDGSMQQRMDSP